MRRLEKKQIIIGCTLALIALLALLVRQSSWTVAAGPASPPARSAQLHRVEFTRAERQLAQDGRVVIYVEPQTSILSSVGEAFKVRVMLDAGSHELDGAAVYLDFDPGYVRVTGIIGGPVLSLVFVNTFDNENGLINYVAGGPIGAPGTGVVISGTLEIMTIEMETVELSGGTPLAFSQKGTRRTKVVFQGYPLPLDVIDGQIVVGMPTPTPSPEPTVTPTSSATQTRTPQPTATLTPTRAYIRLPLILRQ